MRLRATVLLIAGGLALSACGPQGERTLATGALGAATGAVVGAIGGNTVVGAVTGGIVGSAVGYLTCRKVRDGRCR
jgi:hypothetical protein